MSPTAKRNTTIFLLSAAAGFIAGKIFDPFGKCPACPVCGAPMPSSPSGGGGGGGGAALPPAPLGGSGGGGGFGFTQGLAPGPDPFFSAAPSGAPSDFAATTFASSSPAPSSPAPGGPSHPSFSSVPASQSPFANPPSSSTTPFSLAGGPAYGGNPPPQSGPTAAATQPNVVHAQPQTVSTPMPKAASSNVVSLAAHSAVRKR